MKSSFKKFIALFLVSIMILGIFAACEKKDDTNGTDKGEEKSSGILEEKVKIGVVVYDNTDLQQQGQNKYLKDHIAKEFNCEFIISDAIKDSNQELSFIENCKSKGAKGIIAYYTVTDPQKLFNKLKELEMYYVLGASNLGKKELAAAKGNEFIVGGVGPATGDYDSAYEMTKSFLEQGARKLVIATGGKDLGVSIFVDRYKGFKDAIKDFESKNANEKVTVEEMGGFPNDAWFASQAKMISSNPDAIIATFSGEFLWLQPLADQKKAGKIKLGTISSLNDVSAKAFSDGSLNYLSAMYPQITGLSFALLYDTIAGNGKVYRNDGEPFNYDMKMVNVKSAGEMKKWMEVLKADVPPYSADDLKKVMKVTNSKATLDNFKDLCATSSYDDIVARRSGK